MAYMISIERNSKLMHTHLSFIIRIVWVLFIVWAFSSKISVILLSADFLIIENSPPNRYGIEVTNAGPMKTVEKPQQYSIQIKMDI